MFFYFYFYFFLNILRKCVAIMTLISLSSKLGRVHQSLPNEYNGNLCFRKDVPFQLIHGFVKTCRFFLSRSPGLKALSIFGTLPESFRGNEPNVLFHLRFVCPQFFPKTCSVILQECAFVFSFCVSLARRI